MSADPFEMLRAYTSGTEMQQELTAARATIAALRKELAEAQENYHLVNEAAAKVRAENASLKADVERLTKEHANALGDFWGIHKGYFELKAEIERLRASSFVTAVPVEQYERVVKAGDNLEYLLTSKIMSYEVGNASFEWRNAKEGKPSE